MKCLVVDPSPTMTRIIQHILRAAGGEEVLSAPNGEQARGLAADDGLAELALVVTERDLPDGSGLELMTALRGEEGLADLSAVVVSARNSRQDVLDAIQAGADGYVLKPLNQEAMLNRVIAVVEARRAAAEAAAEADAAAAEATDETAAEAEAAAEAGEADPAPSPGPETSEAEAESESAEPEATEPTPEEDEERKAA